MTHERLGYRGMPWVQLCLWMPRQRGQPQPPTPTHPPTHSLPGCALPPPLATAMLDALSRPLLENKVMKLRKGTSHYRPNIPRAVL